MSGGDPPLPPSRPPYHSWHNRPSHRRRGGPPGTARNGWVTRRPRSPPLPLPRPRSLRPPYKHHRHAPQPPPNPSQSHSTVYHSHGPPPLSRNLQGRLRSPPRSPPRHSDLPTHRLDSQPYRGEPGPSHRIEPSSEYPSFRGLDPPGFRPSLSKSRGDSFSFSSERPSLRGPPDHPPPYRGEPGPLYRADSVLHRDDFEARRGMGGGVGMDGMSNRTDSSPPYVPWFRQSGKIHKPLKPKKRRHPPHALAALRASGPYMSKPQSPILSRMGLPLVDRNPSGPRIGGMGPAPGGIRKGFGPNISSPNLSQEFSSQSSKSHAHDSYGFGHTRPRKSVSSPRQQTPRSVSSPDERTNNDRQNLKSDAPSYVEPAKEPANVPNGVEKSPRTTPETNTAQEKRLKSELKSRSPLECNGMDLSRANGPEKSFVGPDSQQNLKVSSSASHDLDASRKSKPSRQETANGLALGSTPENDTRADSSDMEDVPQTEKESSVMADEAKPSNPIPTFSKSISHMADTKTPTTCDNDVKVPHPSTSNVVEPRPASLESDSGYADENKKPLQPENATEMEIVKPELDIEHPLISAESKPSSEQASNLKEEGHENSMPSASLRKQHSLVVPPLAVPEAPVPVPAPAISLLRSTPRSRTGSSSFEQKLGSLGSFGQLSSTPSPPPSTIEFLRASATKKQVASTDLVKQIHEVEGKITQIERSLTDLRNRTPKKSDQVTDSGQQVLDTTEQEDATERYAALAKEIEVNAERRPVSRPAKRSRHPLHAAARLLLVRNQTVAAASHAEFRTLCSNKDDGLDGVVDYSALFQNEITSAIRAKIAEHLKSERVEDFERRKGLRQEYENLMQSWHDRLAASQESMTKHQREILRERDREMLLSTKGTSALLTSRTSSGRTSTKLVPSVSANGQTNGTAELDQMLADIEAEGGTPGSKLIWSKTLAEVPDQNPKRAPPDCFSVLMIDPVAEHHASRAVNPWRFEEVVMFLEKYLTCSKNFIKIASFLEHKSPRDCSYFYYLNKLRLGLKQLTKEASAMKRRGTLRRHLIQLAKQFVFVDPAETSTDSFYVTVQNAVAARGTERFTCSDETRGTSFHGVVSNRQGYTLDKRNFPLKRSEKVLLDSKLIDLVGIDRKAFARAISAYGTDWKAVGARLGLERKSSTHYREYYRRNKRRLEIEETREHRTRLLLPSRSPNLTTRDSPRMSPRSSPRHANHGSRSKDPAPVEADSDPMQLDDTDNDDIATRIFLKDDKESLEHKAKEEVSRPRHDSEQTSRTARKTERDGKKGKPTATWTTEECMQFRILFKQYGREWKTIARLMAPKTPTQIKGYWRKVAHEVGDGLSAEGGRSRSERKRMRRRTSSETLSRESPGASQADVRAPPKVKLSTEMDHDEAFAEKNDAEFGVRNDHAKNVNEGESSEKKCSSTGGPKELPNSLKSDSGQQDGTSTEIATSDERPDLSKGKLPLLRSLPMPLLRSVPISLKKPVSETGKDSDDVAVSSSEQARNQSSTNEEDLRKAAESYGVLELLGDQLHDSEEGMTKPK